MSSVHLLNVEPGDCTLIRHSSDRTTMIDICDGNDAPGYAAARSPVHRGRTGNFRMCASHPVNPISYAEDLGINSIFRFILTHPDMDHMDGFDNLMDAIGIENFWDTGSRREKPDFSGGQFEERDWDRYETVRDGRGGVATRVRRAGDRFVFANKQAEGGDGPDGLTILAPDAELVNDCNMSDDVNDGSYVILYRSQGGRILLPGDAHDNTWAYINQHYSKDVANCSFMLAPHHGRDSARSYDFLDVVRPAVTLMGCCPAEYADYSQWTQRGLTYIKIDDTGNVVLEINQKDVIDVYIENADYVIAAGRDASVTNDQGYALLGQITAAAESQAA